MTVAETFDLANQTVHQGNFLDDYALGPLDAAIDPRTDVVYVTNQANAIAEIDPLNGTFIRSIATGINGSWGITYDTNTNSMYVGITGNDTIAEISCATQRISSWIQIPGTPDDLLFDSLDNSVYVSIRETDSVAVVPDSGNAVAAYIGVGNTPWGLAFNPSNGLLFVSNEGGNSVSVVNTTLNTVISTIGVGSEPAESAFDTQSGDVFVADMGSGNVTVLNGVSGAVVSSIAASYSPWGVALDQKQHFVFVTDSNDFGGGDREGRVTVINASSLKVVTTIATGVDDLPRGIAFSTAIGAAIICGDGKLYTINSTLLAVSNEILLTAYPSGVAIDTTSHDVYVAVQGMNELEVLDGATGDLIRVVRSIVEPVAITFDPNENEILALGSTGLWVIDPMNYSVISFLSLRFQMDQNAILLGGLAYDTVDHLVFATEEASDSIAIINVSTLSVVGTVPVGSRPVSVAVDPITGNVYVANFGPYFQPGGVPSNVSEINISRAYLVQTIPDGYQQGPDGLTYDASQDSFLVSNYETNNLSSLSTRTRTISGSTSTGPGPAGSLLDLGSSWVYVANSYGRTVSVVNISSNNVIGRIPVGTGPRGVTADFESRLIFVTNTECGTISILRTVPASPSVYRLTFNEEGLPSGYRWSAMLGANSANSTTSDLNFSVQNGTYDYSVPNVGNFADSQPNGSVLVAGLNKTVHVAFDELFDLGLNYDRLVPAFNWSVGNSTRVLGSIPSSEGIGLPNGTYEFFVHAPIGFLAVPSQGNVTLSGSAISIDVDIVAALQILSISVTPMQPVAGTPVVLDVSTRGGAPPITIASSGLPSDCIVSPQNPSIYCQFSAPGTFGLVLQVSDQFGQVAHFQLNLTVVAPSGGHPGTAAALAWDLVWAAIVCAAIAAGVGLWLRRRRYRRELRGP